MQKTSWINPSDVKREWLVVDVAGMHIGRAATQIAQLIIGKNKVNRVPNMDCGDYVVVLNSSKVTISGKKATDKNYYRHSGYPGGLKTISFEDQMKKDSRFVVEAAVKNMLPKNKLRANMMTRLHVFKDEAHDKGAQSPREIKLAK